MSYATSGGADQGRTSLDKHQILVTFFSSVTDKGKKSEAMTLPQLADRMCETHRKDPDRLPLLKLAQFGETRNENGTLRHANNMGDITGIEVDYDGGEISFDDAVRMLASLRCVVFTTRSHSESAPRWRALLPTSKPLHKKMRAELVGRVNGLFNGALASESFNDVQSFFYGYVDDRKNYELETIDGDFIDKRQDLEPMARAASTPRGAAGDRVDDFSTFTIPQLIEHLIKRSQLKDKRELQWHWPMVHLTAKLAAAGFDEADIIKSCAPYCDGGAEDPQMLDMVASARRKFGPPPEITAAKQKLLAKMLGTKPAAVEVVEVEPKPVRPADDAPFNDKVSYLLLRYAWCAVEDGVIDLFAEDDRSCRVKIRAWREEYAAWREVKIGPRGGENVIPATGAWSVSPHRKSIDGIRMAPGRDFPVFAEKLFGYTDVNVFKNTYLQPQHEGAGDGEIDTFHDFMCHLIPNERERDWFWRWLAYKQQHPEIPGIGIVFMARGKFGCGRGILASIAERLLGPRYVKQEDFDVVAGDSAQGAFTDWIAGCVLVCCDETQSSPKAHHHGHKLALYEKFKRVVDPAMRKRTVRGKNIAAYETKVHASFWLFTNHVNPFVIPDNDRRITVLSNGKKLEDARREQIIAWRDHPGNIARLARELAAEDVSGFDAYTPIATTGKSAMIDAGYNDVEVALFDIRDMVDGKGQPVYGPAFSSQQLKERLAGIAELQGDRYLDVKIHAAIKDHTESVPTKVGTGEQRRTKFNGANPRIRSFPDKKAFVQDMTDEAVRASLKAWNTPLGGYTPVSLVPSTEKDD